MLTAVLVWLLAPPAADDPPAGEVGSTGYAIVGTVRDADTGEPVVGAVMKFLDDAARSDGRLIEATTGADGRYRAAVPLGSITMWFPRMPPGYWLEESDDRAYLATTPQQPQVTHDLAARRGLVWPVRVDGGTDNVYLSVTDEPDVGEFEKAIRRNLGASWIRKARTAARGDGLDGGRITIPGTSGRASFGGLGGPSGLQFEPEFDPQAVISAKPVDDIPEGIETAVRLTDGEGRTATVYNGSVELKDGRATLVFVGQTIDNPKLGDQPYIGRIVDEAGNGIAGALVRSAYGTGSHTSSMENDGVRTDAEGRFESVVSVHAKAVDNITMGLVVTADGWVAAEVDPKPLTADLAAIDFGDITLNPARTATVRTVDAEGRPLAGVIVQPDGGFGMRSLAVRTDEQGVGVIDGLSSPSIRLEGRYAGRIGKTLVLPGSGDEDVKLTLRPFGDPDAEFVKPTPLKVGRPAPPWMTGPWSDGVVRSPLDSSGRVLVIQFWTPSRGGERLFDAETAAALQRHFEGRDVDFVTILEKDYDLTLVERVRERTGWTAPAAVDTPLNVYVGNTFFLYGNIANSAIVIVGRDGRVAFDQYADFRRNDPTAMPRAARAAGLEWPIDSSLPESEQLDRIMEIQQARMAAVIEDALAAE